MTGPKENKDTRSYCTHPRYKYGNQVTCNYVEAMELDNNHVIAQWSGATETEMGQLDEYDTFIEIYKDPGTRGAQ